MLLSIMYKMLHLLILRFPPTLFFIKIRVNSCQMIHAASFQYLGDEISKIFRFHFLKWNAPFAKNLNGCCKCNYESLPTLNFFYASCFTTSQPITNQNLPISQNKKDSTKYFSFTYYFQRYWLNVRNWKRRMQIYVVFTSKI